MMRITLRPFIPLFLAAWIAACGNAGSAREEAAPDRPVADLNAVLTNEMSDTSVLKPMERKIQRYMSQWQLQGAQLAVMRNDSLLYAKGFGWADKEKVKPMKPGNIMRVASVSKLVTATGIMVLQEQGRLSLKDTVFGPSGILRDTAYCKSIKDKNYYKITVEHLLRHQGGFTVRAGDPMFSTPTIMKRNRLTKAPDNRQLLGLVLRRKLSFVPGTSQAYSNLGYMILSLVIEEVSGQDYETFIRENVLDKAGCRNFRIAGNYYRDRHAGEVRYYVPSNEPRVPEFNNSGDSVVRCYGGNNITALSGAGGWVASAPELALLVAAIDGRDGIRDIISAESVEEMTRYIDKETFSLGWNDTDPEKGWVRTGTLSGTNALIKYFPDGECWIFLSNTSTWKGPGLARYTAALMSELRRDFGRKIPARDLFHDSVPETAQKSTL